MIMRINRRNNTAVWIVRGLWGERLVEYEVRIHTPGPVALRKKQQNSQWRVIKKSSWTNANHVGVIATRLLRGNFVFFFSLPA